MGLTYFKRYRMEIDLIGRDLTPWQAPEGYRILPWNQSLLNSHAEVKYYSFREEIDANVFPCFSELAGCQRLMRDIVKREGFLPETTWLAVYTGDGEQEPCGTIQGVRDRLGMGAIQNLGITPAHRGRRLGTCLMQHALRGFWQRGLSRVYLEVTADNQGAIRLYRRMGFDAIKTVFKAVEVACS